jgi:hypothetical protein
MGIARKAPKVIGIVNDAGEPEIVLEIEGFTVTTAPPTKPADPEARQPRTPRARRPAS